MHIVLLEPEIPANTGNISRTCAITGSTLHLVGKLGFSTDDKYLKRAGLDYWSYLDLHFHDRFEDLRNIYSSGRFFLTSTKADNLFTDLEYKKDDFFVFGKETAGLPPYLLEQYKNNAIRIPMSSNMRSLNLSNAVAIVLYEALRQTGFTNLK